MNRHYDSRQGRFTQPDPLGMGAASLADPQSLNMYSYVGNDPMNRVDPNGQFWGVLFQLIAGLFHSLKPNIINGSFAYGNHPPVSVSFTTNFQNIGVGYGAFVVPLRIGNHWLTDLLKPQKPASGSFLDCVGGLRATGFTKEAADLINQISGSQGTSRDLLAVTWMNENHFNLTPAPNTNGHNGDATTQDSMHWSNQQPVVPAKSFLRQKRRLPHKSVNNALYKAKPRAT